jgi:hypothetical protein
MFTSLGIIKKLIKILEWQTEKDTFIKKYRHLFEGKNIAIVGSSPTLIGSNLGEFIDSHDVVLRINGTRRIKNTIDFGRRTDCVFLGANFGTAEKLKERILDIETNCNLISTSKNKTIIDKYFQSQSVFYFPQMLPVKIATKVEQIAKQKLWDKPFRPPRSGFVAVTSICYYARPKNVSIIGMSKNSVTARTVVDESLLIKNYDERLLLAKHCEPETEIRALMNFVKHNEYINWLDK